MLTEVRGELHHINGLFTNDLRELGVGDDEALVLLVLAVVGLDVLPHFFDDFGTGELFFTGDGLEGGREGVGGLFPRGLFLGGFGFFSLRFFTPLLFFDVGGFGLVGVFLLEILEVVDDDVTLGEIRAGEKGFAKAGAALDHFASTAVGGTGGHLCGGDFSLFGDVDDTAAFGVFGAAEEGAEFAKAHLHRAAAFGAVLVPIEVGVIG